MFYSLKDCQGERKKKNSKTTQIEVEGFDQLINLRENLNPGNFWSKQS